MFLTMAQKPQRLFLDNMSGGIPSELKKLVICMKADGFHSINPRATFQQIIRLEVRSASSYSILVYAWRKQLVKSVGPRDKAIAGRRELKIPLLAPRKNVSRRQMTCGRAGTYTHSAKSGRAHTVFYYIERRESESGQLQPFNTYFAQNQQLVALAI